MVGPGGFNTIDASGLEVQIIDYNVNIPSQWRAGGIYNLLLEFIKNGKPIFIYNIKKTVIRFLDTPDEIRTVQFVGTYADGEVEPDFSDLIHLRFFNQDFYVNSSDIISEAP